MQAITPVSILSATSSRVHMWFGAKMQQACMGSVRDQEKTSRKKETPHKKNNNRPPPKCNVMKLSLHYFVHRSS